MSSLRLGVFGFALLWVLAQTVLLWAAWLLGRALRGRSLGSADAACWLALVAWVVAIFLTLGQARSLTDALSAALGVRGFNLLIVIALALIGLLLLAWLARGVFQRRIRPRALLWLLALFAVAALIARLQDWSPIGRIHLAEYGLVGALSWRALLPLLTRSRAPAAALRLAAAFGALDEVTQGFMDTRYFDVWDVAVNAAAGGIGVAVALLLFPPRIKTD